MSILCAMEPECIHLLHTMVCNSMLVWILWFSYLKNKMLNMIKQFCCKMILYVRSLPILLYVYTVFYY